MPPADANRSTSATNATFHIEIFDNAQADPSGYGEGQRHARRPARQRHQAVPRRPGRRDRDPEEDPPAVARVEPALETEAALGEQDPARFLEEARVQAETGLPCEDVVRHGAAREQTAKM